MSETVGEPRTPFAMIAVASSAGGVTALRRLLSPLPGNFRVPILIVQHLDPRHETHLVEVLARHTDLMVELAVPGEVAKGGHVYLAPPDRHLLIDADGVLSLSEDDKVNFVRPSADRLFESVADSFGEAAVVCVLTGSGKDGAAGVAAIGLNGGTVIVQDPSEAEFRSMPEAAMATGHANLVLPLDEIPLTLTSLVEQRSL